MLKIISVGLGTGRGRVDEGSMCFLDRVLRAASLMW